MKKNYLKKVSVILTTFIIFGFMSVTHAQLRYVDVEPGIGTLNEKILSDTTEDGSRVDPENTVYRLQRGDDIVYYVSALIQNLDWPLTVMSEDGTGARPLIALFADEQGNTPEYCFRPKGDLTLKGLHLTNKDQLGSLESRIIRLSADDINLTIDHCWLDDAGQAAVRLDNEFVSIFLTNSVFSNLGQPANPDNGRVIDDRGNSIDTIIIENSTFYNITQRVIRDGGGHIKYCKINNSNFINVGQRGFGFGVIAGLDFTNNILYNVQFVPRDTASTEAVFEIDSISQELIDLGYTQEINITHNSIYLDTTLFEDWLTDSTQVKFATEVAQKFIDENTDAVWYWNEKIPFESLPGANLAELISYQMDPDLDLELAPDWTNPEPANEVYHLNVPYDFSYTNTLAATGATDGGQLGDRNWQGIVSSIIDQKYNLASEISVYPNPANDFVNLKFNLSSKGLIEIKIFDLVGNQIDLIERDVFTKGKHSVVYDSQKLKSGIYFIQIKGQNKTSSTKVLID